MDDEEIPEEETRKYAEELGVFFEYTSAKNKYGIERLLQKTVYKFLEKNST